MCNYYLFMLLTELILVLLLLYVLFNGGLPVQSKINFRNVSKRIFRMHVVVIF
jgi:hypothetical protein